jgi:hypothetical protein
MKRQLVVGIWVVLVLGSSLGCGSDSTAVGDAGVAGTGVAGSFATAGTTGTAGVTGTAGTVGTAGTSATAGTGGAAGTGNSADCPAAAPMDNDACTVAATQCTYGAADCTCEMMNAGLQWNCNMGFAMQECPAAEPAAGGTCVSGMGNCTFGSRECDCSRDSSTWICWAPADCPATPPMDDAACPLVGMQCPYGQGQGRRNRCDCADTGWSCGNGVDNGSGNDAGM